MRLWPSPCQRRTPYHPGQRRHAGSGAGGGYARAGRVCPAGRRLTGATDLPSRLHSRLASARAVGGIGAERLLTGLPNRLRRLTAEMHIEFRSACIIR